MTSGVLVGEASGLGAVGVAPAEPLLAVALNFGETHTGKQISGMIMDVNSADRIISRGTAIAVFPGDCEITSERVRR